MKETLLTETIAFLKDLTIQESEVEWVGTEEASCSWQEFKEMPDIFYSSSFGIEYINLDLKVVGKDWWFERHEYDGSEWWEFKKLPEKPSQRKLVRNDLLTRYGLEQCK